MPYRKNAYEAPTVTPPGPLERIRANIRLQDGPALGFTVWAFAVVLVWLVGYIVLQ